MGLGGPGSSLLIEFAIHQVHLSCQRVLLTAEDRNSWHEVKMEICPSRRFVLFEAGRLKTCILMAAARLQGLHGEEYPCADARRRHRFLG